ncbi:addiction module toxin, HicA family [Candidatus Peregrinibacteria bacterium]|nr:addiction module toxin, HicA family [Candidatus Peregrinibacteria bacterium]
MPRLTPIHWKKLECIVLKLGFRFHRQNGSHRQYVKSGTIRPVTIPVYNEIDVEIIKNTMRTTKINRDKYFELLKECK